MLSHLQDMERPTHVVGSQGRRGILPRALGRPSVSQAGTGTSKNANIPAKDDGGKFLALTVLRLIYKRNIYLVLKPTWKK
jgi:hypothetical protein